MKGGHDAATYIQRYPHRTEYQRLERRVDLGFCDSNPADVPDAVRMILPPLNSLPRDGFVFFIAAEPCFTARKHLQVDSATDG